MNNMNMDITGDNGMLGVNMNIPISMITSPSVSTFMPEEDASTCLLLPATPSPPPMDFIHPLTPSTGNDENTNELAGDDARAETSSSGSSGIGMDMPIAGTTTLYNNKNVYQNLENNGETIQVGMLKSFAESQLFMELYFLAKRNQTICQFKHSNHQGHTRICTLELAANKKMLVLRFSSWSYSNGWNCSSNDRFATKELQS